MPSRALPHAAAGARLRAARFALGYGHRRQAEFAARLGIEPSKLNHWERGRHLPSLADLMRLARLGIGTDWLVHGFVTGLQPPVAQGLIRLTACDDESVATIAREVRSALLYLSQHDEARRGLLEEPTLPPLRYVALWREAA